MSYVYGCPRIHKIVHIIWVKINIESKENVATGMLAEEEERKKKKNYKRMALWFEDRLS